MITIPSSIICQKCGSPIPADAPQGLCPRCALAGAAGDATGSQPRAPGDAPEITEVQASFPQLEIIELIGCGGMGFVFKARQPQLDRYVALKLLPAPLARDPAFVERFTREARALGRLAHPGIVTVYDFGQAGAGCYLMMEFVDGLNLRQAMQVGRFSPAEALAIVPRICAALQYAHDRGVLHRDIKPENILLDRHGAVKIADFGIAKLTGDDARADLTLTQSGARLGTPTYMAPEQIERPGDVDHRADIYSLGVILYELLTGELPLGGFAPPSARADLDARVDAIVMRALAKERALRQQSASEVGTQVEELTSGGVPLASSPPPSAATGERDVPARASQLPPGKLIPGTWARRLGWSLLAVVIVGAVVGLNRPDKAGPRTDAPQPSNPPVTSIPAQVEESAPRIAAVHLDFARRTLDEMRKRAEVGVVAPRGPEVLGAELAVSVAEAELNIDPRAAARARLVHAESLFAITNAMYSVGKATSLDVEGARQAVAEARLRAEGH